MSLPEVEGGFGFIVIQGSAAWVCAQVFWMVFKKNKTPTPMDIFATSIVWFFILLPIRWWLFKG